MLKSGIKKHNSKNAFKRFTNSDGCGIICLQTDWFNRLQQFAHHFPPYHIWQKRQSARFCLFCHVVVFQNGQDVKKHMIGILDLHDETRRKTLYKNCRESYNRRVNRLSSRLQKKRSSFSPLSYGRRGRPQGCLFCYFRRAERKGTGNGRHIRFRRQASQNWKGRPAKAANAFLCLRGEWIQDGNIWNIEHIYKILIKNLLQTLYKIGKTGYNINTKSLVIFRDC